ncbi:glutaminyl-peptide cyclotransferase [Sphingomonas prati]|uniref:Glutamine cyclotransferase n=1 Tax=Sphingomonas prati TaxID=1843237 RepID=A0A7W9BUH3_9SPHN|nr:glutaminyl-peptide cyclotransferase [Sphingomonas prati]MBB5730149.1 glutamine cyclotransferase [Sphingomonas prati]GGE91874.1 glutaminyl-peptide cyclotransferase [Sphingomonas prati]
MRLLFCLLPLLGASLACSATPPAPALEDRPVDTALPSDAAPAPIVVPTVVARYPHDTGAFTQGLLWHNGSFYESTGQVGQSQIRHVRLADGKVLQSAAVRADVFGEGMALWKNDLVSLSWQNGTGWRWDRATLRQKSEFRYLGEGWGLTQDGRRLILSDGTSELRFLDPVTFAEQGRIRVTANGRPVLNLNELEYVKGEILANVWQTAMIARIDPSTGRVKGWLDLRSLVAQVPVTDPDAVLNGIAYDATKDRLFVTGKYWPSLFEIRIPN